MAEVTIDRLEGPLAVLVDSVGAFEVPRRLLPPGAREGDVMRWELSLDPEATRRERQRLAARRSRLSQDDDGGDITL